MTYSHFQFLPLRVMPPSSSSKSSSSSTSSERYRLLKFADQRDPRHKHLYPISGSMVENYESQSNPNRIKKSGRLLELEDNWCLLDRNILEKKVPTNSTDKKWRDAPHPHRGHAVLYVPGHWGSFSQARSMGAHGTRWTGPYAKGKSDQEIYESLATGEGMHDGSRISDDANNVSSEDFMDWFSSSSQQQEQSLDGFVMDVFALDFDGQGAALHASKLLRQAEFFARAVETIVEGCHLSNNGDAHHDGSSSSSRQQQGITIVAHSIGAWVVRIALKMHPHLSRDGWIRNVVTLASPLGSVPYAVDAGVHDIARRINDDGHDEGDVTMISISGGLRDEMIPPEMCQVPPSSKNQIIDTKTDGFVSDAFLATSILQSSSSSANGQFGMDHRAIVWCYDLLKVVREVIFSLVVATDQGLVSAERMDVARSIMHGGTVGFGSDKKHQESNIASFQEGVINQHMALLQEKGYSRTVSIQLSAPYHLNSLLKLCIVAALLHPFAIFPTLQYVRRKKSRSLTEKLFDMALSLLAIPFLVFLVTWVRQLEFSPLSWDILPACYGQECQLLLGAIYIQSQLATLIYFLLVNGVCYFVAAMCDKCFILHKKSAGKNRLPMGKSFRGILLHLCMQQLRIFAVIVLPLTAGVCYIINIFILGNEDLAWDRTSVASCCFISSLLLILIHLVILACKPSPVDSEKRRSLLLVLFLSLVKATFGKALYAFSLTTQWGQSNLDSYDDFLAVMNSSAGVIGGHHNEMTICVVTILLPAFFAVMAFGTHDIMSQNSTTYWNKTEQIAGNGDTANGSNMKLDSLNNVAPQYNEPKFIIIAHASFICWFTWNVSVNFPVDNLMVPFCSFIAVVTTYLLCLPFSFEVMDICSAIAKNDLSLQCDSTKIHGKSE